MFVSDNVSLSQGFESVIVYPADPEPFDTDQPENKIQI